MKLKTLFSQTIFALSLSSLCGCSIYSSSFQCKPGKGVGCAPVGEVLDMIIERDEGEDLFVVEGSQKKNETSRASKKKHPTDEHQNGARGSHLRLQRDEKGVLSVGRSRIIKAESREE